jgi:antitoxin component of RelBE/YafQ-DinJ toxin-antitoxin module
MEIIGLPFEFMAPKIDDETVDAIKNTNTNKKPRSNHHKSLAKTSEE